MWAQSATIAGGDRLFVKIWIALPAQRIDLLAVPARSADVRWLHLEEVRSTWNSVVLAPSEELLSNQWEIFGRVLRYDDSNAGQVTVWNRILSEATSQMVLDSMASSVEVRLKERPDWLGGQVTLAMIDLRRDRIEAGRSSLERLLPLIGKALEQRPVVAWEIAQELAQHNGCLETGAMYFRVAMRSANRMDWTAVSSPWTALLKAYVANDRLATASLTAY